MKITVLYAGRANPFVGWAVIDEFAELIAHYFKAELLSPKPLLQNRVGRWLRLGRGKYEPMETAGGDVLFVVANDPSGLAMVNAIADCRKKFNKIYGLITDSYFYSGYVKETELYDAITVTAHEDIEYPENRFGIPVHQLYHGINGLVWAPRQHKLREIDLIAYGRIPKKYHTEFMHRFHVAESPSLYLHSPLGNVTGDSVHQERGMLFKLLHRSSISLAFHLYVDPQGGRPRSMMVTSRWMESLVSGCIVAGKRPVSRMAEEMLFWPDATVELSDDPTVAAEQLSALIARHDLVEQRRINISRMLESHDWRYRIQSLCQWFQLAVPDALTQDLFHLHELSRTVLD